MMMTSAWTSSSETSRERLLRDFWERTSSSTLREEVFLFRNSFFRSKITSFSWCLSWKEPSFLQWVKEIHLTFTTLIQHACQFPWPFIPSLVSSSSRQFRVLLLSRAFWETSRKKEVSLHKKGIEQRAMTKNRHLSQWIARSNDQRGDFGLKKVNAGMKGMKLVCVRRRPNHIVHFTSLAVICKETLSREDSEARIIRNASNERLNKKIKCVYTHNTKWWWRWRWCEKRSRMKRETKGQLWRRERLPFRRRHHHVFDTQSNK